PGLVQPALHALCEAGQERVDAPGRRAVLVSGTAVTVRAPVPVPVPQRVIAAGGAVMLGTITGGRGRWAGPRGRTFGVVLRAPHAERLRGRHLRAPHPAAQPARRLAPCGRWPGRRLGGR